MYAPERWPRDRDKAHINLVFHISPSPREDPAIVVLETPTLDRIAPGELPSVRDAMGTTYILPLDVPEGSASRADVRLGVADGAWRTVPIPKGRYATRANRNGPSGSKMIGVKAQLPRSIAEGQYQISAFDAKGHRLRRVGYGRSSDGFDDRLSANFEAPAGIARVVFEARPYRDVVFRNVPVRPNGETPPKSPAVTTATPQGTGPKPIFPRRGELGSAFRPETNFRITRADHVVEPLHAWQRNEDGTVTVDGFGLPDTTVTFELLQPGFLRETFTRVVVKGSLRSVKNPAIASPLRIHMIFGDANGDNAIDATDVALIKRYVGVSESSWEWSDTVPSSAPLGRQRRISVADLDEDGDGKITAADVAVAKANIGTVIKPAG